MIFVIFNAVKKLDCKSYVYCRDSTVSVVTRLWVRQPRNKGLIAESFKGFLFRGVRTVSGAQSASCQMGTGRSFPGGKATGTSRRNNRTNAAELLSYVYIS
jgi:hypothetical protein